MFGLFKKYDVSLSPKVQGMLLNSGKPLVHYKVKRVLTYDDQKYIDEPVTDAKGRFSFDEKVIQSKRPGSTLEDRVWQDISVTHEEKGYLLWYMVKATTTNPDVISNYLAHLHCDLTNPEKEFVLEDKESPNQPFSGFSICNI